MNDHDVIDPSGPRTITQKRWATRRTPVWVFAAIILVVAATVAVSLVHKPSQAQRASDLRGYLGDVNAGITSCAGGLRDALTALDKVEAGDTGDSQNATGILTYNAQNCSPANNEPLQDFTNYQVAESLASFRLDTADDDVVTWAFDAQTAQLDMLAVLKATTPTGKARANATLTTALAKLNAERSAIDAIWGKAQRAVGNDSPFPNLSA
jgi:hypothetical protein